MMAPIIVVFGSSLPPLINFKVRCVKVGPTLTQLSGSAHDLGANRICVWLFVKHDCADIFWGYVAKTLTRWRGGAFYSEP